MLTKGEMLGLHKMADCFVLIQRAEGWGLPHFEACMMGKPVITTNYSANLEFTRPEHSYLVGYNMTSVRGMDWIHWYRPDMVWADPSVAECGERMRHVFNNREEARGKGKAAKAFVHGNFTWNVIGKKIMTRLTEVVRELK
jgi:glycosyltransferase involved in cell wall biosynthesis